MGLIQAVKNKLMPERDHWDESRLINSQTQEELSPSGRFRLVMRYYNQGIGYWRYSRGTVYRVSDGVEIADIKRNYSTFHHSLVTKDEQEYLISGRSYMGQTIVNLETGIGYDDKIWKADKKYTGFEFCWARHWLSPDGNTLVVNGCVWAGPYEFRFFDFTDPAEGWPHVAIPKDLIEGYGGDTIDPVFESDGSIAIGISARYFVPLQKYEHELTEAEEDALTDEEWDNEDLWKDVSYRRIRLRREALQMRIETETELPASIFHEPSGT